MGLSPIWPSSATVPTVEPWRAGVENTFRRGKSLTAPHARRFGNEALYSFDGNRQPHVCCIVLLYRRRCRGRCNLIFLVVPFAHVTYVSFVRWCARCGSVTREHTYVSFLRLCFRDGNGPQGKTAAAKVFQPYPEDFPKPKPPQYLGANVYGLIHQQQRQNYAMHKLLTSLQAYFARPAPAKEVRLP